MSKTSIEIDTVSSKLTDVSKVLMRYDERFRLKVNLSHFFA